MDTSMMARHLLALGLAAWCGMPTLAAADAGRAATAAPAIQPAQLRLAINDLIQGFGTRYPKGGAWLKRLDAIEQALTGGDKAKEADLQALAREALLANPLLDDAKLLLVRRGVKGGQARKDMKSRLGFISLNSHTHVTIGRSGWDDALQVMTDLRGTPKRTTIHKPDGDRLVRDIDIDYAADRILFTSLDDKKRWAVYEAKADGGNVKQISPVGYEDVDWFDGCWLPDGRVIMLSTASYQALPCENGSKPMAQIYLVDPVKKAVRQITYEQDSDYTPSVTNDGRVLYTRWEYSDLPHYYSRVLMTMNPDGTSQVPLYGSGSYYPTAFLHARVIPGDASKVIGIVGGHHDLSEIGRLLLIDPAVARSYPFKYKPTSKEWGKEGTFLRIQAETLPASETGCLHEFPGYGKDVEGDVCDAQVKNQFERGRPYFAFPAPLSAKHVLVSAKPTRDALWGIYYIDVFDNMILLAEEEDAALFEPVVLRPRPRPHVIPDRIKSGEKTALVNISDIYQGPGLAGIARGTVKSLRVFSYHYNYVGTGGHASLGVEAGWDIKRVLGTVPIESDGSVNFVIPANTPVSLQPIDADGAALQLMRSWLVGMPGERVSCTGCHEDLRNSSPPRRTVADSKPAQPLKPWYGETRPFAFEHEVFPVVQKFCIGCHDGSAPKTAAPRPNMRNAKEAYDTLHPFIRRPGPESELPLLTPMDWHTSTSPLMQMLAKNHHGVVLDQEAKERLNTWVDLNAPYRGKWSPKPFQGQDQIARRLELAKLFANVESDPEAEYLRAANDVKARPAPAFIKPAAAPVPPAAPKLDGFPFSAEQAAKMQKDLGTVRREVKLPNGESLAFVRIPAGSFVMGSSAGYPDEWPQAVVRIAKPFWMSVTEIRNRDYAAFDAQHDTRYVDAHGKDHTAPGYIANHPDQPVARVTWQRAAAFCDWLGKQARATVRLPTEAQWEWAARAGTATPFFYGDLDTDFSTWANLADRGIRWNSVGFVASGVQVRKPYDPKMNFPLHEDRFQDKWFVVDYVAQYQANPWGLQDMVGNVSEWTRSSYKAYPYQEGDGRNGGAVAERKVARGGSWASRPKDATSAVRFAYASFQAVHDVGFRVVIED